MSLSPTPSSHELSSPLLSARLAELVQYMGAPLLGRLTDEQRALSLAIARRSITAIAQQIDQNISTEHLWADWLNAGIPTNEAFAAACFSRAEEHRWRSLTEAQNKVSTRAQYFGSAAVHDVALAPRYLNDPDIADAHMALKIADQCRFDHYGYPILAVADISGDLYRHLLNEIARWRLGQISRDRLSSEGLGEAVRDAWEFRAGARGLDACGRDYYDILLGTDRLSDEANDCVQRQDWPTFIALAAASQGCTYSEMTLVLLTRTRGQIADGLAALRLDGENLAMLAASLAAVSARSGQPEPPR